MSAESIPAIWATMSSWLTPTVLFLFLNVMIGTIAVTSSLATPSPKAKPQNNQAQQSSQSYQLARSPSVLQRLKSINLYRYKSEEDKVETHTITQAPQDDHFQEQYVQDESLDFSHLQEDDHFQESLPHHHRSVSDTRPTLGEPAKPKLPKKMKKSASAKSVFSHFEAEYVKKVDTRKVPSTMKEGKTTSNDLASFSSGDDGVDAKADDFINKFKQQLKLQRMDSITRYKDMVIRGSTK